MLSTVRATVAEELAFGLENRAVPREDMLRAVERTAARTGLTGLLDRDPATLSGGELRRLAVACAVIAEPDILILDEPLASLDAAGAAQIRDLVRSLCGAGSSARTGDPTGTATGVVLLSQVADALAREAAHWTVLDGGTVTAAGAPAQLIGSAELERAGVLGAAAVRGHGPVPAAAPRPGRLPAAQLRAGTARTPRRRVQLRPRPSTMGCPAASGHPAAGTGGAAGAAEPGPHRAPGRDRRCDRSQRCRQIHPAAAHQRTAAPFRGRRAGLRTQHRRRAGGNESRPRSDCFSSTPGTSSSNGPSCGKPRSDSASSSGRPKPSTGRARRWPPSASPRLTRPSTRPNCPPRSSGCSPWPRCWPASRPCWPWTSRP